MYPCSSKPCTNLVSYHGDICDACQALKIEETDESNDFDYLLDQNNVEEAPEPFTSDLL